MFNSTREFLLPGIPLGSAPLWTRASAAPPGNHTTGDANLPPVHFEPGFHRSQCLRFVSAISRHISQLSCCKLGASWGCSARAVQGEWSKPSPRSVAQPQTFMSLCPGTDAQAGQGFELQQPQPTVSVTVGETLTLTCTTSGDGPLGPVKWLKGWGSGNETVYDQTGSFPRVTRAVGESNTDFSIHIRDVRPEDAGTYYCVKFCKALGGVDEVFRRGKGTVVSLRSECSPVGRCSRGPHPTAPHPARGGVPCCPVPTTLSPLCLVSPQTQPWFLAWWLQL